jgi:REP element-mobilizing transposase RayT
VLPGRTIRFSRRSLPHLEVEEGRYFVTVRCADSLPGEVVTRLLEVHRNLRAVTPQSEQFAETQRRYFWTMEKYLDRGNGGCILRDPGAARAVVAELDLLAEWQVEVPHYSIMPNHWHALLVPRSGCVHSLSEVMKRAKGRTAKAIRQRCGGEGAVWQREWFDRWVRDAVEWVRLVDYIHNNPVQAGIVRAWHHHPWTR